MVTLAVALKLATPPVMGGVGGSGGLPLDGYVLGPVYSFRKLVSSAVNCVRIRSTGDNAEANFGFIGNIVDTAGIAAFIVTHGGSAVIVTWYDQNGVVDITNATAAQQPLFVVSGINSKPTARFDGSDDRLANAATTAAMLGTVGPPSEVSWFVAQKQNAAKLDNHTFQYRSGSSNLIGYSNLANAVSWDWTNSTDGSGRVTATQPSGYDDVPHVIDGYRSLADIQELFIDGVSIISATRAADPTASVANFAVGDEQQTAGDDNFDGDISELVFLKNYTSAAQIAIRANMTSYYIAVVVTGAAYFPPRYFPSRYFARRYFG